MRIKISKTKENRLIEQLKQGDEDAAKALYNQYADIFFRWVRKFYSKYPEAEIADIYQEAFLTFYYQIRDGKLKEIRHSLQTYLFAIGKNFIRNELRKRAKFIETEDEASVQEIKALGMDLSVMTNYQKAHQAEVVGQLLIQIGDPCKTVLELAFFRSFAPEAIAAHMGYKTEATARVRKVRCLNQLGELLEKMGIAYDQIFE